MRACRTGDRTTSMNTRNRLYHLPPAVCDPANQNGGCGTGENCDSNSACRFDEVCDEASRVCMPNELSCTFSLLHASGTLRKTTESIRGLTVTLPTGFDQKYPSLSGDTFAGTTLTDMNYDGGHFHGEHWPFMCFNYHTTSLAEKVCEHGENLNDGDDTNDVCYWWGCDHNKNQHRIDDIILPPGTILTDSAGKTYRIKPTVEPRA